jgi:hypothetical protein
MNRVKRAQTISSGTPSTKEQTGAIQDQELKKINHIDNLNGKLVY